MNEIHIPVHLDIFISLSSTTCDESQSITISPFKIAAQIVNSDSYRNKLASFRCSVPGCNHSSPSSKGLSIHRAKSHKNTSKVETSERNVNRNFMEGMNPPEKPLGIHVSTCPNPECIKNKTFVEGTGTIALDNHSREIEFCSMRCYQYWLENGKKTLVITNGKSI